MAFKFKIMLVGENKGFSVYWFCHLQYYSVYKDGKLLIDKKYRFSDVKCYLD